MNAVRRYSPVENDIAEVSSQISDTRLPQLPPEIIEVIVEEAWSSSLSIPERISLYTNLCLVNHTWLNIFIRVALVDVHIVSAAFADKYLYLLHEPSGFEGETSSLLPHASSNANRLCRSLTFHVDNNPNRCTTSALEPAIRLYADRDKAGDSVTNVLYMIDSLDYVPNLQRVCLDYVDWGFSDVFDQMRLFPLPSQVRDLEIRYSFSKNLKAAAGAMRRLYWRNPHSRPTWQTPNVRRLTVSGAPALLVNAVVQTCPNLEVLEVYGMSYFGGLVEKMPETLKSMVLQLEPTDSTYPDGSKVEDDFGLERWGMRRWFQDCKTTRRVTILGTGLHSQARLANSVRKRARSYGLEVVSH